MREVKINKVMNGFVVSVGCQTLVFEDRTKLLVELSRYLDRPEDVEKEYTAKHGLQGADVPRPAEPVDQCSTPIRTAPILGAALGRY